MVTMVDIMTMATVIDIVRIGNSDGNNENGNSHKYS